MAGNAILVLVMLLGFIWPAEDPFSGTWVLNVSKSNIPPPAPKSQIAHVVVDASSIEITEELFGNSDERLNIHVKAKFDGKDYPVTGTPYADTVAYQRSDRNTIKGIAKKAGKVIALETIVLSQDGKYMTGTYSGTDPAGKEITAVYVMEKK
jgi:hypothetical protein